MTTFPGLVFDYDVIPDAKNIMCTKKTINTTVFQLHLRQTDNYIVRVILISVIFVYLTYPTPIFKRTFSESISRPVDIIHGPATFYCAGYNPPPYVAVVVLGRAHTHTHTPKPRCQSEIVGNAVKNDKRSLKTHWKRLKARFTFTISINCYLLYTW